MSIRLLLAILSIISFFKSSVNCGKTTVPIDFAGNSSTVQERENVIDVNEKV